MAQHTFAVCSVLHDEDLVSPILQSTGAHQLLPEPFQLTPAQTTAPLPTRASWLATLSVAFVP